MILSKSSKQSDYFYLRFQLSVEILIAKSSFHGYKSGGLIKSTQIVFYSLRIAHGDILYTADTHNK